MPSVLITGGAGYLGSEVTAAFLRRRYRVTVIDNFRHGVPSLSHLAADPNLTIVFGDARDPNVVRPCAIKSDFLVPLAALVGAPACERDRQYATEINLEAVRLIVSIASNHQTIIYPNTNSGYGVGGADMCTEETPLNPISHYGQTKQVAENFVLDNGNGISLRFATLFGPSARMRLDLMVNDFVYRAATERVIALFEGKFRRNFLHVRDAAELFPYMADGGGLRRGQAYNAGLSTANLTKLELCETIKQQVPNLNIVEIPFAKDPDKRDYVVSNAKLEATGWAPAHSLQHGIASLLQCYRQPFSSGAWRNA